MGGCCCCSSRRAEADRAPVYYYCPQDLEEREPLSTNRGTSSVVSSGLLVDTNLETSTPGTYRAPPAPLPYDVGLTSSQTSPGNLENRPIKIDHVQAADSQPIGETDGRLEGSDTCQTLSKSDCKSKTVFEHEPPETEDEPSKVDAPIVSVTDDEDVCPTCLEEYDAENPRILTKCEHHFHLSCILEWMERSDTCPVCDQIMVIDHMSSE
ncbi:probable E3 ubiquitin-protein ligase RHB1A isoform X2 [Elaeis guineensis]|uniref:RING-type E3 ubiquitin transferase n=1 Tax=Elaeis guineensis var. tenera TaxID=51953 RepID=A0A6I9S225_ELAGV|nr:probable E3 ubiquitin-protein ligase RHB1A [Elaeis guineensis]XP_010935777.1 probable E3 ubiquitin-protein ligase RHB1A [Elaeis guineensis]XP_010935778.1 probable E3 ubiquitin-protein ligase RHB1A [Elaeis guineensis]XP_010935779.1 probable E3 ubiquitin-protein ligase RHB1A [Elaeis guineensis]XP_010935781.1 probable E3 ubiquitin-protein ligase RHB1A [Elaeis guineensis]XP_010935782.1 probable E3 ubiquitin-protein ligase RHB1A [Elaeis guineensis]XP_029123543.1 probable E3 ubiquitin-protein li